jgi:hypothetical protein
MTIVCESATVVVQGYHTTLGCRRSASTAQQGGGGRYPQGLGALHRGICAPTTRLGAPCASIPRRPRLPPLGLGPPVSLSPAGAARGRGSGFRRRRGAGWGCGPCARKGAPADPRAGEAAPHTCWSRWAPADSAPGADQRFVILTTACPRARPARPPTRVPVPARAGPSGLVYGYMMLSPCLISCLWHATGASERYR